MKKNWLCSVCLALILLSGCGNPSVLEKEPSSPETRQADPAPATDDSDDVASDADMDEEKTDQELASNAADVASNAADVGELIVIDVRSSEEYESGHVDGTINIAHTEIVQRITEVTSDKSAKIYCHCRHGGRAGAAQQALEAAGFTNVESIGGIDDAKKFMDSQK